MTNRGMADPPPRANWMQFTTERQPMSRHSVSRFTGPTPKGDVLPPCSTILRAGQIPRPVPVVCIFSSPPFTLGDYSASNLLFVCAIGEGCWYETPLPSVLQNEDTCPERITNAEGGARNAERKRRASREEHEERQGKLQISVFSLRAWRA